MNPLILQLLVIQVGAPLALIMANAFMPVGSLAGLILRFVSVLAVLCYSLFAGLWLFPPYWTPWLLAALHLTFTYWQWRRFLSRKKQARLPFITAETLVSLFILGAAIWLLLPALNGRLEPEKAVDIAMPLGPGRYLVVSGGTTPAINAHMPFLTLERAQAFRGQAYAIDIIGIDALGLNADGIGPADPERYVIYGAEVRAPCTGDVAWAETEAPDMPVPQVDRAHMTGNSLLIACEGTDYAVALAHMAPGSVTHAIGDTITEGAPVGRVGNSGNTGEPHLHVHVQRGIPDENPLAGEPVWFTVEGNFLVRNAVFSVKE